MAGSTPGSTPLAAPATPEEEHPVRLARRLRRALRTHDESTLDELRMKRTGRGLIKPASIPFRHAARLCGAAVYSAAPDLRQETWLSRLRFYGCPENAMTDTPKTP